MVAEVDYRLPAEAAHEQTFVMVYEALFPRLCKFAERFVEHEDARDAVQSAMTLIWQRWPVIVVERPGPSFFFHAVRDSIKLAWRGSYREGRKLERYFSHIRNDPPAQPPADAELERAELAAVIDAAVAGLPERCREAFVLVRENEFTYEQAAAAMAVSPLTAKKHMTFAQRALREAITDAGYRDAARAAMKQLPAGPAGENSQ
jgi:RNA polymerase sigma-70 factor (ECF subfamily)